MSFCLFCRSAARLSSSLKCRVLFAHSFWAGKSKLRVRWLAARTLPRPPLHKPVFACFHFLLSAWSYTAEFSQFNTSDKQKWSQISHCAAFLFPHSKTRKPRGDRSTMLMLWYNTCKRYPVNSRDKQQQICWPQHVCKCESSFSWKYTSIIYLHLLAINYASGLPVFIINLILNKMAAYPKTSKSVISSVNFHIWWDSKSRNNIWATTSQNQQNESAHPPSLIRVFAVRSMCS